LGVSDRPYFAWLRAALGRFEAASGHLASLGSGSAALDLWVLAGATTNPAVEFVVNALGRDRTAVHFLDKYAKQPGVTAADFNAMEGLPNDACDVLLMTRASYMIEKPRAFLMHAQRVLRPGGLAIIDWVHGSGDAPVLDLPGFHDYGGCRQAFFTTYADPVFLAEWPGEFQALIRHVNRPPWRSSRQIVPQLQRLLGGGGRRSITLSTYLDTLGVDLTRAGRHLIGPGLLEEFFKVIFREARYFHPLSRKFHLYLLTMLRPVGK
jgi:SAM-dependent methyltransferase